MGLDELALCLDRSEIPSTWQQDNLALPLTEAELKCFEQSRYRFLRRREIEYDFSIKQVIPYVIVLNSENNILIYRRRGTETRLHNLWSLGIGGHINDTDCIPFDFKATLFSGMKRECFEELGTEVNKFSLTGIINEEQTDVGHSHIGIVFWTQISHDLPVSDELKDWKFVSLDQLPSYNFELWSSLALRLLSNLNVNKNMKV